SVVSPGRWPRSISVRRSHTRRVSLFTPIFSATEMMAAHSEGYSWACSWTIRTARSRSSAGYLGDRAIAPSSQGLEPPGNPGRFNQLGSTRLLTDSSGLPQATYSYDPFGIVTSHTGSASTP